MSMQGYLDERDERQKRAEEMAVRDAAARAWMQRGAPEAVRLLRFDGWVRLELSERIDWTWAGLMKARRIEQCRVELEGLVVALWRRGWMLDGAPLAGNIRDALDDVGAAQKAGRVRDFWPFFKSVVDRYVGVNAEEIRTEAMALGSHVGQVFQQLNQTHVAKGKSLTELLAQRRQEQGQLSLTRRLALERQKQAQERQDAAQPQLF